MQRSAWLIASLVIGGLLLLAASLAVVLSRRPVALLPADTPSGVVQRFLQADQAQDYRQAFAYLTANGPDGKPRSYEQFRNRYPSGADGRAVQVVLDGETVDGDLADVYVRVTRYEARGPSPFGNPVSQERSRFQLRREGGEWRILEYPYWVNVYY